MQDKPKEGDEMSIGDLIYGYYGERWVALGEYMLAFKADRIDGKPLPPITYTRE